MTDENDDTDSNSFPLNTRLEVSEASVRLLEEASRSINILVYDYDDTLLPSTNMDELVSSFVRLHERNRFHFLCSESDLLRERGSKLIKLARRFSSFIKLKQLPDGMKQAHEQFIVIDENSSMQTQDRLSHNYYAHLNDRARARKLNNHFEELWQRSSAIQGVHVTGL
jgi:hypothetical protein